MNPHATVSVLLSAAMQAMIRKMSRQDGLTSEQIAQAMNVPASSVAMVLAPKPPIGATTEGDPMDSRIAEMENALDEHVENAIATLGEFAVSAESEGVRLAASTKILEMRSGSLRSQRPVRETGASGGLSATQFGELLSQAMTAYAEQMRAHAASVEKLATTIDLPASQSNN